MSDVEADVDCSILDYTGYKRTNLLVLFMFVAENKLLNQ